MGWQTRQLYRDYFIDHEIRIRHQTTWIQWKSKKRFFVAQLSSMTKKIVPPVGPTYKIVVARSIFPVNGKHMPKQIDIWYIDSWNFAPTANGWLRWFCLLVLDPNLVHSNHTKSERDWKNRRRFNQQSTGRNESSSDLYRVILPFFFLNPSTQRVESRWWLFQTGRNFLSHPGCEDVSSPPSFACHWNVRVLYPFIWVFPKIVVPPNHPFAHRVWNYKPSTLGYHYFVGNTHV